MERGGIMSDKTKMFLLRLSPELHKIIKVEACKEPVSLQFWITEAIEDKLKNNKISKSKE